ncbi:MAG: reverse gyrase [Sulfolobaceae archaeon]|nr:reverse gyrase [Sulfolobaceae archaeon]
MIKLKYYYGCPNCGGPIDSERALAGLPCDKCLSHVNISEFERIPLEDKIKLIYNLLVRNNSLKAYWDTYLMIERSEEIIRLFEKLIKNSPWSLQRSWIKKLAMGNNFIMSAPTGLGKTTTLLVYSVYTGENALYLVPTKALQEQICDKLSKFNANVACGKVDETKISVLTVNYINKNFEQLKNYRPAFIAVDDADAIIKSGKTTDKIVELLGIPQEAYESAKKLVKLKAILPALVNDEKRQELISEINKLETTISLSNVSTTQLVVASATVRPKGIKQKALKYLIGFEPSTIQIYSRNIIDSYLPSFTDENLLNIIQTLGRGGLILVSKEYSKAKIRELAEKLERNGIRSSLAISGRRFISDFSEGKVDVLIGSANYYGVAVRGIDEPKALRYVIFYGVPKFRMKLLDAIKNPYVLLKIMKSLSLDYQELEKIILHSSPNELNAISLAIKKGEHLDGKLEEVLNKIESKIEEVREHLKSLGEGFFGEDFIISKVDSTYYYIVPDVMTYIQGSGRSSRLYNGALTLGLSIILVDDQKLFEILYNKLRRFSYDVNFRRLSELNLSEISQKLDESRSSNNAENGKELKIKTALMVVESPTKARTIARMFGVPSQRIIGNVPVYETIITYNDTIWITEIMASKGHIYDVTVDDIGTYGIEIHDEKSITVNYTKISKCLSCGRTFTSNSDTCPYCGSTQSVSSLSVINALRKLALEVDAIFIATDPDYEGEKIAYDIAVIVSPYNSNIYRITYHEVTKNAILAALSNPRKIDINAVYSQVVRRVEDRLIGFSLSNILKSKFSDRNHGAGRVQTPVLGLILDKTKRYKERMGWIVDIGISKNYRIKKLFSSKADAENYSKNIKVEVKKISEKVDILNPLPPYTTDSLLEDAYEKLRLNPVITIKLAQDLFERGLITYHRTDSTHVSSLGISIAKSYMEAKGYSGEFVGRSWGSSGAHEAIRPTRPLDAEDLKNEIISNPRLYLGISNLHIKLYDLIFRRFIASQMRPAKVTIGKYLVSINSAESYSVELRTKVEGGFSIIYSIPVNDIAEGVIVPEIRIYKGSLEYLYTYSNVIQLMKELNLGRPSTYSKTLSNLLRHGYIIESKKRAYLIASSRGEKVYSYLSKYFSHLVSVKRTADLLNKMDKIALGEINADDVIHEILTDTETVVQASINSSQLEQNV